jgi:tetratricopeptide (TPR) repeat protein
VSLTARRAAAHRVMAITTGNLGALQSRTGDYPAATANLTRALGIYGELGDRGSQAGVLNDLGEMLSRSGTASRPATTTPALAIAQEISAPLEEARALEDLGHCLLQDGHPGDAAAHWQQALEIYQRIGSLDARRIQKTLRQYCITTAPPPPSGANRQPGTPTVL